MQFIVVSVVLLCTALTEAAPPVLNVTNPFVMDISKIKVQNLVISCTGDQNLEWITTLEKEFYDVDDMISYKTGEYQSVITVYDVILEDTGLITCKKKNGEHASSYVYVYDGERAFVNKTLQQTLIVEPGNPFYLDCRTTHPNITVKLIKNSREMVPLPFPHDQYFRFEVVFKSVGESGSYFCVASHFSAQKNYIVKVVRKRKSSKPTITKLRNAYFEVGVQFNLTCKIPIDTFHQPKLVWNVPDFRTDYTVESTTRESNIYSVLTVRNPKSTDAGNYKCRENITGAEDVKQVLVQDKITPFVQFIRPISGQSNINVLNAREGEAAKWAMAFVGYPSNINYEIYSPSGKLLDHNSPKISLKFRYGEGNLVIQIAGLKPNEFGAYKTKLIATNYASDEQIAVLRVMSEPKIRFRRKDYRFALEETATISATILSYPNELDYPNISWILYDNCAFYGKCDRENYTVINHQLEVKTPNSTLALPEDKQFSNRFLSTVAFTPSGSGLIKCRVGNQLGTSEKETYYFIEENDYPFFISIMSMDGIEKQIPGGNNSIETITAVQEDQFYVSCFALDFMFSNLTLRSRGTVHDCSTHLSTGLCSKFEISSGDTKLIECSAISRKMEVKVYVAFRVELLQKKSPELSNSSNVSEEGGDIDVESGEDFSVKCHVEGNPTPRIMWFKDGVDITSIDEIFNNDRVFISRDYKQIDFMYASSPFQGQYVCRAENRFGSIEFYTDVTVFENGVGKYLWAILAVSATVFVVFSAAVFFLVAKVKRESQLRKELRQNQLYLFEKGNIGDLNTECTIDEQADLLPYDMDYEIDKSRIKLGKILGAGAFGRVMLAEVEGLLEDGRPGRAAVKMCKDGADMGHLRALTLELKIMVHLGRHLNIVNLVGAHTTKMQKGDLWILVEYCKYGNILKFIQRHKNKFISQIDHVTGSLDINRMTPISSPPMTPAYFDSSSSQRSASSPSARPGLYVDNPHYAATQYALYTPESGSPPAGEAYVLAAHLPTPQHHPSSHSAKSSDFIYHVTPHTEVTAISPVPFSPSSTLSEEFTFDTSGNPVIEGAPVPAVSGPFTTSDLICWSWQVANGMEYLSKRKVLHGDLAARNLLLAENNVVKISDFGLSRDMYKNDVYMKKGDDVMPIKWMAPEAIQQKVFSTQSDVWAFGVTMWELFSLGNTPYPGIPLNPEFTLALENGMRMEKPKYANDKLYSIMMHCWKANPLHRPNFTDLADQLSEFLSPDQRENYVSMNDEYILRNKKWMEFKEDYLTMVTSPDFENINKSRNDLTYIEMMPVSPAPSEFNPPVGYLDMRSVRSSSPKDSIFSPRHPIDSEPTMFPFSGEVTGKTNGQTSPVETSSLLIGNGTSEVDSEDKQVPPESPGNNNKSDVDNFNEKNEALYQNIDKTCSNKKNYIIPTSPIEVEFDEDYTKNYVNI